LLLQQKPETGTKRRFRSEFTPEEG